MSDFDPSAITESQLLDPHVDAAVLQQVAAVRRDLWPAILRHPQCYPALRGWINSQVPTVPAPPVQVPAAVPTAEQWIEQFQRVNGREPTAREHQAAQSQGQIAQNSRLSDPSVQQMSAGARQVAAGAKDFFNAKIAPAAAGAARAVQQTVGEQQSQAQSMLPQTDFSPWIARATLAVPVAAFLAIISLFLPIATGHGLSANWFSDYVGDDVNTEGGVLLTLFVLTVAAGIALLITGRKWARITAGILGSVAGVFGSVDGFANMGVVSDSGGSVGVGIVLLAILSVLLLVGSILILLGLRKPKPTAPQVPQAHPPSDDTGRSGPF